MQIVMDLTNICICVIFGWYFQSGSNNLLLVKDLMFLQLCLDYDKTLKWAIWLNNSEKSFRIYLKIIFCDDPDCGGTTRSFTNWGNLWLRGDPNICVRAAIFFISHFSFSFWMSVKNKSQHLYNRHFSLIHSFPFLS